MLLLGEGRSLPRGAAGDDCIGTLGNMELEELEPVKMWSDILIPPNLIHISLGAEELGEKNSAACRAS